MSDYQLTHSESRHDYRKFPICLLVNNLHSPVNVGSIFRIADSLGVTKIYLTGTTPTPPNPKINKTARATVKSVDYEYIEDARTLVHDLKTGGYTICSLEITQQSTDIRTFDIVPTAKICLIIGAENEGVAQSLLDISDEVIHIPMFGQNSSMNVAVATAIAVFDLLKKY